MFQRGTINHKYKPSRSIAIPSANNRRKARIDTTKRELLLDVRWIGRRRRIRLFQQVALREKLLCSVDHLLIHGEAISVAPNDNDVCVLADEVGAVSNSYVR